MTQLQTMYPGVANSPNTFLKEDLARDATIMYLADGSVLGTLPTLAVIGGGPDAETVLVTSAGSNDDFTIIRGMEGTQQAWKKADPVARNWTNKDYETLVYNIKSNSFYIDSLEEMLESNVLSMQRYTDNEVNKKVDKVPGKGLSTNDYTDAAKAKVDAIPPDPKYTDTVPDLTPYARMSDLSKEYDERKADIVKVRSDHAADIQSVRADIKTRLADMEEDSEHRTVTDADKKSWNGKIDAVSGKGLSTNDYTTAEKEKVARMKESIILTQAEYDALPTDQQNDESKIYFIKA